MDYGEGLSGQLDGLMWPGMVAIGPGDISESYEGPKDMPGARIPDQLGIRPIASFMGFPRGYLAFGCGEELINEGD